MTVCPLLTEIGYKPTNIRWRQRVEVLAAEYRLDVSTDHRLVASEHGARVSGFTTCASPVIEVLTDGLPSSRPRYVAPCAVKQPVELLSSLTVSPAVKEGAPSATTNHGHVSGPDEPPISALDNRAFTVGSLTGATSTVTSATSRAA